MNWIWHRTAKIAGYVLMLGLLAFPGRCGATSFFYHFSNVFEGATPSGSSPWLNVSFTDVSAGAVAMTISAGGLTGSENLGALYLNLNPLMSAANLTFSLISQSGGFADPSIATGKDKYKADGDGKYDIRFTFSEKSSKTFTANEYVTYLITSRDYSSLSALDFDFLSKKTGGSDPFLAAAEIMGIPGCDTGMTGWIAPCDISVVPVPEPGTVALIGLAAGLFAGGRRLFKRQAGA